MAEQGTATLYARLGGYDAVAAVADDLLPRVMSDPQLGRFWTHRGADGIRREKQLLIDFLCASAGGPLYYTASGCPFVLPSPEELPPRAARRFRDRRVRARDWRPADASGE